jgi:GAF domain-containing protein
MMLLRRTVKPFTEKQIALVQTFADQAVIAIENTRLLSELRERNREVTQALEQQTATADVLKTISGSAFDLDAVLRTLVKSALNLCRAKGCFIYLPDGEGAYRPAMQVGWTAEFHDYLTRNPIRPGRGSVTGRVLLTGSVVHIPDVTSDPDYTLGRGEEMAWHRTTLGVPLLRNGAVTGVFVLVRDVAEPFSEREIELVRTFSDQAVIAIENVRLFKEVEARTTELAESLKQQTATADVLKVISRAAFDLEAVLDALAQTAARVCDADMAFIFRRDGDLYRFAANFGLPAAVQDYARSHPLRAGRNAATARVALEGRTIHIPDVLADPDYTESEYQRLAGYRTILGIPLLRDGTPIGVFALARPEVKPFTPKQIELVETFADQAVIAIENVRLFEELQGRTAELAEALQQQTATADVLKVISRSAFDLHTVLEALAETAKRVCEAESGAIMRRDGEVYRFAANSGYSSEFVNYAVSHPFQEGLGSGTARAALERRTIHIPDVFADPNYTASGHQKLARYRTMLAVPLMRQGSPIGIFILTRPDVNPFTPKQIELVETFADQAVIAIENVRLFEELQARTAELSEALQQQTATADVLKVISRSAFDLEAVLDTLVDSAYRLCGAAAGLIYIRSGDAFECKAIAGAGAADLGPFLRNRPIRAGRGTAAERVIMTGEVQSVEDFFADPDFDTRVKAGIQAAADTGSALATFRSTLAVPMKRDDAVVGVIAIARTQTGPFPARQVELLQTFADQAVIAIENARLFEEVQARTRDLEEALQQQTATAEVLKVISRSTYDLQAVLDALAETATRECEAEKGAIMRRDGTAYQVGANFGFPDAFVAYAREHPFHEGQGSGTSRAALERRTIHIPDVFADPNYTATEFQKLAGFRTLLAVPLVREGSAVGVFILTRDEVRPFTARQIELVEAFADQAVIAIENVRLFEEVQARTAELGEALRQQTATADVLKVISRSAFDLQTVLDTLAESVARLCEAEMVSIAKQQGDAFYGVANFGAPPEFEEFIKAVPHRPGRTTTAARSLLELRPVQIEDVLADPEYQLSEGQKRGRYRTTLGIPLMRGGNPIGVMVLFRSVVRPFTEKQIELAQTFADQAVIAIENVRLFEDVQSRTRELARSLDDLRTAQDRLVQTEKLASLGQLTAGIAHEIKNPLNFVNNFAALSGELIGELSETLEKAPLEEAIRTEVAELTEMLKGNLDKVVQHGKRADSIVKNMLLHSREGSGERRRVDINAVVEESLNLAYHGARAERQGFNITLERSFDPKAGEVDLYPQEITRVLLNLISNGFYATRKRGIEADANGYEPKLLAATRNLGGSVEIRIRDNGTGIPPEVREKMFNPFFTTKPAGEGTGLGLSLSHDIVVKQHAGTIEVDTVPGEFTEFRIVLPRAAANENA